MKIKIENLFAYLLIALMLCTIGFTLYRQSKKSVVPPANGSSNALEVFAPAETLKPNNSFLDLLD